MKVIPWRNRREEIDTLRDDFDRMLETMFETPFEERLPSMLPAAFRPANVPPVNVSETDKAWLISVELPGLEEKDIHVELRGNLLSIWGERTWREEKKEKQYHRVESQYGSFRRSLTLPSNLRLEPEAITAKYSKGVLELSIPKVEETPTAKIPVKGG
jgi:HSP20 family protein